MLMVEYLRRSFFIRILKVSDGCEQLDVDWMRVSEVEVV